MRINNTGCREVLVHDGLVGVDPLEVSSAMTVRQFFELRRRNELRPYVCDLFTAIIRVDGLEKGGYLVKAFEFGLVEFSSCCSARAIFAKRV